MADWWPSNRIPQGGILQPAKVKEYSPETHKFLKELMQESHLTMQQRNKINYFLRNGEPLPSSSNRSRSATRTEIIKQPRIVISNTPCQLRSKYAIMKSGAYEREKYIRTEPLPDREEAKLRLQQMMEYGRKRMEKDLQHKNMLENKHSKDTDHPKYRSKFEELKAEIDERIEWLNEMEKLGEGKRYRDMIQQEVAIRVKEIEKLKPPE